LALRSAPVENPNSHDLVNGPRSLPEIESGLPKNLAVWESPKLGGALPDLEITVWLRARFNLMPSRSLRHQLDFMRQRELENVASDPAPYYGA
jgi:hypothetical protein